MSLSRTELQDGVRKALGAGVIAHTPNAIWAQIVDLGWLMLTVPEDLGGLGLGTEALAALHFELGRALVPGPAISQALVIEALAFAGQQELLESAMSGQKMAVGHLPLDADEAQHFLVGGTGGIKLVPAAHVVLSPRDTWDKTRRLFALIENGDGQMIADGAVATALADRLKKRLCLMLSADSLGGATAILDMTVEYLKTRQQFDRPLAMFQALKHRAADLKAHLLAAEALLWSRAADDTSSVAQFGALKAHACRTYVEIAEEAIQLHGGIGLTQEHPCHYFLKRAMLNAALGGDGYYWDEIAGREIFSLGDK